MSGICSAHRGHDKDCPRCRVMIDSEWIARERKLWDQLMDPRTYRNMRDQDGKPVTEAKKVAKSWVLYKRWLEH